MSVTDKERVKYIKQVKKYLLCSYKEKKRIISDINSIIDDFLSNNSQADMTQLEKEIGTPHEIAEGFMENLSLSFFIRKRRLFNIIKTICAITVLLFAVFLLLINSWAEKSREGCYYEISIHEYIDGSRVLVTSFTEMIN